MASPNGGMHASAGTTTTVCCGGGTDGGGGGPGGASGGKGANERGGRARRTASSHARTGAKSASDHVELCVPKGTNWEPSLLMRAAASAVRKRV